MNTQITNIGSTQRASLLTEKLSLGCTELYVADLEKQLRFYRDLVGLDVLSQKEHEVILGYQNTSILILIEDKNLPLYNKSDAGLYHLAILFESHHALAQVVKTILLQDSVRFTGSSDHLVSEAFYFTDPEGNGVELYYDRDQTTWIWQEGKIIMDSLFIDPVTYINNYPSQSDLSVKKPGHIHLQVGDLAQAKEFYVSTLGLYITAELPSALFLSDGKYHHTIGMNTWHSEGAAQRTKSLGLKQFELILSNPQEIMLLKKRLSTTSTLYKEEDGRLIVHDPWHTMITFKTI